METNSLIGFPNTARVLYEYSRKEQGSTGNPVPGSWPVNSVEGIYERRGKEFAVSLQLPDGMPGQPDAEITLSETIRHLTTVRHLPPRPHDNAGLPALPSLDTMERHTDTPREAPEKTPEEDFKKRILDAVTMDLDMVADPILESFM